MLGIAKGGDLQGGDEVKWRLALERRTTGDANPAGGDDQKRAVLKRLSVFMECPIELVDLGLQGSTWKPKEEDASVGKALLKDELTEIAVGNDKDPLLLPGDGQDIGIGETMRIIPGDGLHVMCERLQVGNESKVSALVKQEVHRVASERVPLGGFGETSSPAKMSLA